MPGKVFITGANKGIGRQTARRLGLDGWTVIIGARDKARGEQAVSELAAEGVDACMVPIDLINPESVQEAAKIITSEHPDLHMLINNAGIPGDMRKPGFDFTADELRPVMETNFFGPFELIRLLMPTLEANGGRILNITIPVGSSEHFNPFAYKTTKAALNVMTQSLAQSFRSQGMALEIFAVMPGGTTTDLNGNSTGPSMKTPEQAAALIAGFIEDGKNHNGEVITEFGTVADYNAGLFS